ncbi:hypothetical protein HYV43_07455 [Candidatus Micrarchaeota archaeon]|nr:hypothetical protein [Candidatus Micrarchaeota archaeon]
MAKHSKKEMTEESAACEDCGKSECVCEGGECCGACGPSACGGHGYGMHGGWAHKKMFVGFGLIVLAVLWYLKNIGTIPAALFWPIVFALSGLALLIKGWWLKRREEECCGHC